MADAHNPGFHAWLMGLLDRYERPLTRYATKITGDVETARDVVQETYLRLCADGGPRDDNRVAAWLFTVCRNRSVDAIRKEKPMKSLTANRIADQEDDHRSPAETAVQKESESLVLQTVAQLPPQQREAIRLRFQNGLNYREISDVMQTSKGNVGYLVHVAIKSLREQLVAEPASVPAVRRNPS